MAFSPTRHTIEGEDLESIMDGHERWTDEITQLSPGKLGFKADTLNLAGVSISRFQYGAALRMETERIDDSFIFNAVIDCSAYPKFRGAEIRENDAHVQPADSTLDYVTSKYTDTLTIAVDQDLASKFGWSSDMPALVRSSPSAMKTLIRTCKQTLDAFPLNSDSGPDAISSLKYRDQVLTRLSKVLPRVHDGKNESSLFTRYDREYSLTKRAEEWNRSRPGNERLSIPAMANALNVSPSTLHRAFINWTGISPARFFALKRLNDFRRHLYRFGEGQGSITEAAIATGHDHLGRLSQDYKKQFGELPSESLRRW